VYEERFERAYGFYRPYLRSVIYHYLDCGILRNGFARVRCGACGHEYLLAFSCKRRHFCPPCHQKRVVEFGEWVCGEVLKKVLHLHFVFSIPKILRRYFLYDRSLLSGLSRCVWESLRMFLGETVPQRGAVPGAVIAIQTFGDFLGFYPHCHTACTDGNFCGNGIFRVWPRFAPEDLRAIYEHWVLRILLSRGKITQNLIALFPRWIAIELQNRAGRLRWLRFLLSLWRISKPKNLRSEDQIETFLYSFKMLYRQAIH
jgi:hypothetical protein